MKITKFNPIIQLPDRMPTPEERDDWTKLYLRQYKMINELETIIKEQKQLLKDFIEQKELLNEGESFTIDERKQIVATLGNTKVETDIDWEQFKEWNPKLYSEYEEEKVVKVFNKEKCLADNFDALTKDYSIEKITKPKLTFSRKNLLDLELITNTEKE